VSWFSEQIAAGLEQIRSAAGEAATYNDGALDITIDGSVPRRIVQTADQQYDATTIANGRIWDVKASLLINENGSVFTPRKGHRITHAGEVWLVVENPVTQRCFEHVDGGQSTLKIFCQKKVT